MNSIKRHPLIAFFVLAYAISWTSFYALSGPFLFPFGSIVAAVIIASVTQGPAGLKDLLFRSFRWRVSPVWYLLAIAVAVVIAFGALYLNSLSGPPVMVGAEPIVWYQVLLMLPMALVDAPLWEDSGWRGFAMPRFSADHSRLFNTFILGLLLAGWHLPLAISSGRLFAPYVITTFLSAFVTNWIYYNSRESALLAMLYHAAANAMGAIFFHGRTDDDLFRLYWLLALTNFIAALIIILAGRNSWLKRQPTEFLDQAAVQPPSII